MAEQITGTPGRQTMELTPAEQAAVERMRMSPADRAAEQAARKQARLDAMAPEVRQVIEQRNARVGGPGPLAATRSPAGTIASRRGRGD